MQNTYATSLLTSSFGVVISVNETPIKGAMPANEIIRRLSIEAREDCTKITDIKKMIISSEMYCSFLFNVSSCQSSEVHVYTT